MNYRTTILALGVAMPALAMAQTNSFDNNTNSLNGPCSAYGDNDVIHCGDLALPEYSDAAAAFLVSRMPNKAKPVNIDYTIDRISAEVEARFQSYFEAHGYTVHRMGAGSMITRGATHPVTFIDQGNEYHMWVEPITP